MFSKSKSTKTLDELEKEVIQEEEKQNRHLHEQELADVYAKIYICQYKLKRIYTPEIKKQLHQLNYLNSRLETYEYTLGTESKFYKDTKVAIDIIQKDLNPALAKAESEAKKTEILDQLKELQQIRDKLEGKSFYCPPEITKTTRP